MALFVMSDIHGKYQQYRQAIEKIGLGEDDAKQHDTTIEMPMDTLINFSIRSIFSAAIFCPIIVAKAVLIESATIMEIPTNL